MTINGLLFIELSAAPLSVSLPSLTTAFRVWANRILPACYGTDLLQQLEDAGWTGNVYVGGNLGSGTCP